MKYRPILTTFAVAGLICGGAVGTAVAAEPPPVSAATTMVQAEPAASPGLNAFAPMAGSVGSVLPAAGVGAVSGATPGLYGGTMQNACDGAGMASYLAANPDRANAFASAEGIAPAEIGGYLDGLTPVSLRADTAVTNNGFAGGVATPFQAVLQAGTAVMVDRFGVPQVRCACGNPLEGSVQNGPAGFTGDQWEGLSADDVDTITASDHEMDEFELVTPSNETITGITVRRPNGRITTRTPTGEIVARLDQAQAVLHEGPCVDVVETAASRSDRAVGRPEAGVMVVVEDMVTESGDGRWPRFAPEALRNGIVSMLSLRLAGDQREASALNLYADRPEVFDDAARTIAQAFADQAAIALYGAHQTAAVDEALANRDVIGQAKGILIERHGLTTDTEAFTMLAEASQRTNVKLHEVARWLVGDTTGKQAARLLDER